MGLLGTIVSIVPTVADIVGKLFGAKSNDYVKFKMFHSAKMIMNQIFISKNF